VEHGSEAILQRLVEFARAERARTAGADQGIHLAKDFHTGVGHAEQFRHGLLPRLRRCGDLSGCRVLEVGAGMGFIATLLSATDVGYVVATDRHWEQSSPRSESLVHAFESIARCCDVTEVVSCGSGKPVFNGGRLAFVQAEGACLPFADESFDIVFTHGCLEHFDNLEAIFAEMWRVLRPGALLYSESEKFWASRDGSHLYEIFPAPWAHLLAPAEALWRLYEAEWGGKDILWPGKHVNCDFFIHMLERDLNHRGVRAIKNILIHSGCDLVFWQQMSRPEDRVLLRQLDLRRSLSNWPLEELLTSHLAFGLRKRPARWATRLILRVPWTLKQIIPEPVKHLFRRKLM